MNNHYENSQNIQFHRDREKQMRDRLEKLYAERDLLDRIDRPPYDQKIKNLEADLIETEMLISKLEVAKTPKQVERFLFVVVSTKEKIKKNVGRVLFNLFDEDCYHKKDNSKWKPFKDGTYISDLLLDVCNEFKISPIYIDGEVDDKYWQYVDDKIQNSACVIDLFSLDEINLSFAIKFDTSKAAVLVPLCRYLHHDLVEFSKKKEIKFKVLDTKRRKYDDLELISFEIPSPRNFKEKIYYQIKKLSTVQNQSSIQNNVRNVNLGGII